MNLESIASRSAIYDCKPRSFYPCGDWAWVNAWNAPVVMGDIFAGRSTGDAVTLRTRSKLSTGPTD